MMPSGRVTMPVSERSSFFKLISFSKPSESRVRFLILDISLGCGFNVMNAMNGLMHDAFWKSLQIVAALHVEYLQVG